MKKENMLLCLLFKRETYDMRSVDADERTRFQPLALVRQKA